MSDSEPSILLPCPDLDFRWVHAGSQHLDLPIVPVTAASTSYKAFTADESSRIEQHWESISSTEKHAIIDEWGKTEGELAPAKAPLKKSKEKERRGSTASARSAHDGEILRSGEEQPHDEVDRDGHYKDIMLKAQREYENLELISGVPVSQVGRVTASRSLQDSLFEVSLQTLSLHPTFWTHTGPRVSVIRGAWFLTDETKPCSWELAEEIERGYRWVDQ
jgi:hypothetical protein